MPVVAVQDAPGVAAAEEQPTSPLPRYYSPQQVQGNMNARGSMDGAAPVSSVRVEGFGGDQRSTNTLDEPVWQTIKRDLKRVFGNVKACPPPPPILSFLHYLLRTPNTPDHLCL